MNFFRFAALINRPRNVELLKKILSMPHPKFCGKRIGDKAGVWEGVHTCTPPSDL